MSERSALHGTIVVERTYEASPARVFAAWSHVEALRRWAAPGGDWEVVYDRFEFRVGGGEVSRFGPKGGESYVTESRYEDIVPNARIVSAGSMTSAGKRLSVGLMTVELHAAGGGCQLVLTEQTVFLDGGGVPTDHEAGWNTMLDKLGAELKRQSAAT